MNMGPTVSGIARSSASHPWRAIGIWASTLAIALVLTLSFLSDALSTDVTTLTNNPESTQARDLIQERLGEEGDVTGEIIVVTSPSFTVDDPAFQGFVEHLYDNVVALDERFVIRGTHYWIDGDESLVSDDRRTTIVPLGLSEEAAESIERVHALVQSATESADFDVLITGEATLDLEITRVAESDLAKGESIGIALALIVLALVFGTVVAALLPIALALLTIPVALGATAVLGQLIDLPVVVINIMTMLGLAVGIDYSLFVVSRFREERRKGRDPLDAISVTGATAGRTVLVSGITVALAISALMIMPDTSNRAIGAGAVLVVLTAVMTTVTLLPALLRLMGDRLNALSIPRFPQGRTGRVGRGFWDRTSDAVLRKPVLSLILAGGFLLAMASFVVDLNQGEVGISALPDGLMSKDAYVILDEEFGFGQDLPVIIVVDGPMSDASVRDAVQNLVSRIDADPLFASTSVETHAQADLAIVRVWLAVDATSDQAMQAVGRLRDEVVPATLGGARVRGMVTGKTAEIVDMTETAETYTPLVILFVLGLSFVLLTVAFRSIVVPVKALLMNLLSVGAAYGLLVVVFQRGVGTSVLGFQQVDAIQTGLPLFLFAVLFGLSMDYHVFLLSRIRERFLETGDNDDAVAYGLRSTGRLISGAALIMVAVFSGFALGDMVPLQQMGFGLAVAVLVDATIIRCVLVPASMRLLGRWNWYLPSCLHWLPEVRLDSAAPANAPGLGD